MSISCFLTCIAEVEDRKGEVCLHPPEGRDRGQCSIEHRKINNTSRVHFVSKADSFSFHLTGGVSITVNI